MEESMKIDEKATVQFMKEQLQELKLYCANMRLTSILYGDENETLQIEDPLGEYLHFSRSIVQISKQPPSERRDPVLLAMHRQQKHREALKQRDTKAYILLQGIAQLKDKDKELLFDVYVRQYSRDKIMRKEGGIVESTYHRRLHKALLHLAQVLCCEIYKEEATYR